MSAGSRAVVAPDDAVETVDTVDRVDVDPALLRVLTRVAHREHLLSPAPHTHLAHPHSGPARFTRRRPVSAPGASAHQARGTTARKVIWS